MQKIQQDMAERALELLALPTDDRPRFILDLGCGSGLSGAVLSASGHYWVGIDISESMLRKSIYIVTKTRLDVFKCFRRRKGTLGKRY